VADDGTFAIEGLRRGVYTLVYTDAAGRQVQKDVKAPSDTVTIELPPGGMIHGRIIDAETGEALARYNASSESDFATVGADGSFLLTADPGRTELTVHAEGYARATRTLDVAAGKTVDVTIGLTRGRRVSGRVTGAPLSPVAGAYVSLADGGSAYTGEDGEFDIAGQSEEADTLTVTVDGYRTREVPVPAGAADLRLDVYLERGRTIRGRVVTSDGAAVDAATVMVHADTVRHAMTDANGAFVVEGLEDEEYKMHAVGGSMKSDEVRHKPGDGELVLRLNPPVPTGTIHGTVAGFAGAGWDFGSVEAQEFLSTFIGRDGRFRLERVRAGKVEVRAVANDGGRSITSAPVEVTVPGDGEVEVQLSLSGFTVRGTVIEGDAPAIGRKVSFIALSSMWSSMTDEQGAYEITALLPDTSYLVRVEGGTRPTFETSYTVRTSATFDIRLEWARLEGRVVDAAGAPVARASINLTTVDGKNVVQATADAAGAFKLESMPGSYTVEATRDHGTRSNPKPVILTSGRTTVTEIRLPEE
jgi:hypothetical protein